ncbi:hypothetical protein PG993_008710 [Apiospora rasikravindrae]|uniref:WAP domain-containing protein n=1 Tax=Apiospora rasikravindrae TaxID=990691 RepID=A0ABR1SQI4_9PEZI
MKMQFAFVAALVAVVAAAPATTPANPMSIEARQCVPEGGRCNAHSQCCSNNCRFGNLPNQSTCRPPLGSPNDKL